VTSYTRTLPGGIKLEVGCYVPGDVECKDRSRFVHWSLSGEGVEGMRDAADAYRLAAAQLRDAADAYGDDTAEGREARAMALRMESVADALLEAAKEVTP